MSVTDYVNRLKETKTFKSNLISCQEYSFQSKWGGLVRTLPTVPRADDDRHIVVLEIRGDQPNIRKVLQPPQDAIQLTSKDADKLLFVFIEMRPHEVRIDTPTDGYTLGDGHRIGATFTVTYRVVDAREFWKAGHDPLAALETAIIDAARSFFLNTTSRYLVTNPSDVKKASEQAVMRAPEATRVETAIVSLKGKLEDDIRHRCHIAGFELLSVGAHVQLSSTLQEHLRRTHDRLYGKGGVADRQEIDFLIDNDPTFHPFSLRTVIMHLDVQLLEDFYTCSWSDAMRRVAEKLAQKKEQYLRDRDEADIARMKRRIDAAQELGLDEMDIKDLKEKAARKLLELADNDGTAPTIADVEYLQLFVKPQEHAPRLTNKEADANGEKP